MQLDKLDRFTTILGISALVFFMPMIGYMFGWAITVEFDTVQNAFADQLIEGVKYKVTLHDGIDGSDQLR